jgi:hypothetical protein
MSVTIGIQTRRQIRHVPVDDLREFLDQIPTRDLVASAKEKIKEAIEESASANNEILIEFTDTQMAEVVAEIVAWSNRKSHLDGELWGIRNDWKT